MKTKILVYVFILSVFLNRLLAQSNPCGFVVNAGPDITICAGGPGKNLQGTTNGYTFYWDPPDGLSSTKILTPFAKPSMTTSYILIAKGKSADLFTNGEFETGSIFPATSQYTEYTNYNSFSTSSGGYMVMSTLLLDIGFKCNLVNYAGSYTMIFTPVGPGTDIWCETIALTPNTDYWITYKVFILATTGPAVNIGLKVNGTPIFYIQPANFKCSFLGNGFLWNSGSETSGEFCFANYGGTNPGFIAAIDNIHIQQICEDKDTVTVTVEDLIASALPPGEINCLNRPLAIDASASSQGPGITYDWTTKDGLIIGGEKTLKPIVDTPGTYTLKITTANCEKEMNVIVKGSVTKPDISIKTINIDCQNATASIQAASKSKFPKYEWSGPKGFYTTIPNYSNLKEAGEYTIKVTDAYGCESTETVEIKDNRNKFETEIIGDNITCTKDSAILKANSTAFEPTYRWKGPFMFKKDSSNRTVVRNTGWYYLTTTDGEGCEVLDSFYVKYVQNMIPITIQADTIKCSTPDVILKLQTDTSAVFDWKGPNGFKSNLYQPLVSESGWYYVSVKTKDGCTSIDSFFVEKSADIPDIYISKNDTLTCNKTSIQLTGGSNSPGVQLEWNTPAGFIKNQTMIQAVDSGNYIFTVIGINGCKISKSVQILKDETTPIVFGYNDTLTCLKTSVTLRSKISDPFAAISWLGPNGFNALQDSVQTNQSGTYTLIGTSKNGCTDTTQVIIAVDTLHPSLHKADDTLNCIKNSLNLILTDLYPSTYSWIGPMIGPNYFSSTQKNPVINTPGTYVVTATLENGCTAWTLIQISSDLAKPIIQVNNDTLTCKKDSIVLNASKDQLNANAEWSGPAGFKSNKINPFIINPGNYQLIVTNPNGCKDTASLLIFQDIGKPDLTANNDTLTCGKLLANLLASSTHDSLTYLWTGPNGFNSTAKNISVNQAGVYSIRIRTQDGCFSLLNVQVTEDTIKPDLQLISDTLNCLKTQINLNYQSGSNLISLQWNGPGNFNSTQKSPLITQGGNYTLKVTSANQCTEQKSINIIQDTIAPGIFVSPDSINCSKREVNLSAIVIPNQLLGEWTLPNQQKIKANAIKTKDGGDFIFDVIGDNNCVNSILIQVPVDTLAPELIVKDDTINCYFPVADLNVISNTPGLQFEWRGPGNYVSTKANNTIQQGGNYHIKIIAHNGCINQDGVFISVDTVRPNLFTSTDSIDCMHLEANLISSSDITNGRFIWKDDKLQILSNTQLLKTKNTGNYFAEVLNPINGCLTRKLQTVIQDSLIISDVIINPVNPICGNTIGSAQVVKILGGHQNMKYSIDQKQSFTSNPNFNSLAVGNYTLYVIDNKDCEFQKDFEIVELPFIETNLVPEIKLTLGDSARLNLDIIPDKRLIKSIEWKPSTFLSCTDCEYPIVTPLVTTNYEVTVIDSNGCQSIQRIRIVVETPKVWVPNAFSPNGDNINDQVWIHGSKAQVTRITIFQIFDRWGNRVFENTNFQPDDPSKAWNGTFNDQKCNPGVYIYLAEIELIDGQKWIIKGDITLIR